ncbi:hypothetical protein OCU04_009050 [Sclerotinia nivalis]|uniref:Uncharacterized protein n=1 Tax=Sclerotinia nivalis TaxID=352851 RepID=A0A9X0DI52_9HELO|nr:hypothetical protein OCU04_009050 [Sclerotinia nivalis]
MNMQLTNSRLGTGSMARTIEDKQRLREIARQAISHQSDLRLGDDEEVDVSTALNYLRGGNNSGEICGAVVDRKSGQGYVCLHQRGTISEDPKISTGPNEEGYEYFEISDMQGFFVFGSAAVLYVYRK